MAPLLRTASRRFRGGDRFETRVGVGDETIIIDLPSEGAWRDGQILHLRFDQDATTVWPVEAAPPWETV